jgi:hypothetical protein
MPCEHTIQAGYLGMSREEGCNGKDFYMSLVGNIYSTPILQPVANTIVCGDTHSNG